MSIRTAPGGPEQLTDPRGAQVAAGAQKATGEPRSAAAIAAGVMPEILLLAGVTYLFVVASGFKQAPEPGQLGASFWPQLLCVGIAACCFGRGLQKIRAGMRGTAPATASTSATEDEPDVAWSKVALAAALVVGYVIAMVFLGYVPATALFVTAFTYLGGRRRWYVALIGLATSLLLAYVFLKLVYLSLPSGVGAFDRFSVLIYQGLGIY